MKVFRLNRVEDDVCGYVLVGVFVPDGLQFVVRRRRQHRVELPDDGRQLCRLVPGVELQDGRLKQGAKRGRWY